MPLDHSCFRSLFEACHTFWKKNHRYYYLLQKMGYVPFYAMWSTSNHCNTFTHDSFQNHTVEEMRENMGNNNGCLIYLKMYFSKMINLVVKDYSKSKVNKSWLTRLTFSYLFHLWCLYPFTIQWEVRLIHHEVCNMSACLLIESKVYSCPIFKNFPNFEHFYIYKIFCWDFWILPGMLIVF